MNIGSLIATIGVDARDLDKGLGDSMRKFNSFGKNVKRVGAGLTAGVTAPLMALGASSFNVAADFEASMAQVAAVSGATASEFKALESEALRLGSSTKFTASEVSGLQLEFAKLGFSSDEINKVTASTLALAQASGSDLATSAEVAGSTLRAFGLDASETQRVTDVMASSFSSSALDMGTFADSMKYVGPVANAAGLSIEQTTGLLGTLANAGIKGSAAGTSLRRIISELGSTGGDVAGAIQKLAAEGLNLADAKDEVGRSAQSALLVLSKNTKGTAELTDKFKNAKGAAGDMAAIMDATSRGGLAKMQSAIEGAQISIGKALAPTIMKLVGFVERAAASFAGMDDSTRSVILTVAAIAAAIGPLLIILPQLVSVAGIVGPALGGAFTAMTGPIGLAIAAIAAIVGAIFYFWDDVKQPLANVINYFINLYNENETLRIAVAVLKTHFVNSFKAMKTALMAVVDGFGVLFKAIGTAFTDGFGAAWDVLKDGFSDIKDDVAEAGEEMYESYVDAIADAKTKEPLELVTTEDLDRAKDRITGLLDFTNVFTPAGGGAGGAGGGGGGQASEGLAQLESMPIPSAGEGMADNKGLLIPPEAARDSANAIKQFNTEVATSVDLSQGIASGFEAIGQGIGDMATGALTFKGFLGKILESLGSLLQQIGSGFIAAAVAAKTFYANLIANPVVAIGAGVAFIAAGAIIKNLAGRLAEDPPALAEGGIAFGRSLVEVGEYSGVRANPEVIAPLDKLQGMMNNSGSVEVFGTIRGKDIFLSQQRTSRDQFAVTGL